MDRIIILMELIKERLDWRREDQEAFDKWRKQHPNAASWEYNGEFRVTPSEIKQLLMVLRRETVRFEKSL